jgi:hypothetical protein
VIALLRVSVGEFPTDRAPQNYGKTDLSGAAGTAVLGI